MWFQGLTNMLHFAILWPSLTFREIDMRDVHDLPTHERDYAALCASRCDGGRRIAALDCRVLGEIALAIRGSVMIWADLFEGLDLAPCAPFDSARAAVLVAESVFDEVLEPAAWRVLASALARAEI